MSFTKEPLRMYQPLRSGHYSEVCCRLQCCFGFEVPDFLSFSNLYLQQYLEGLVFRVPPPLSQFLPEDLVRFTFLQYYVEDLFSYTSNDLSLKLFNNETF